VKLPLPCLKSRGPISHTSQEISVWPHSNLVPYCQELTQGRRRNEGYLRTEKRGWTTKKATYALMENRYVKDEKCIFDVSWQRRLVVGLLPRRTRFFPSEVDVGFMDEEVTLGRRFL
jgi:hypothetical protein